MGCLTGAPELNGAAAVARPEARPEARIAAHLGRRWRCRAIPFAPGMGVGWAWCRHGNQADALGEILAGSAREDQWNRLGGLLVPWRAWRAARSLCGIAALPCVVAALVAPDRLVWARVATGDAGWDDHPPRRDPPWALAEGLVDNDGAFIEAGRFSADRAWPGTD